MTIQNMSGPVLLIKITPVCTLFTPLHPVYQFASHIQSALICILNNNCCSPLPFLPIDPCAPFPLSASIHPSAPSGSSAYVPPLPFYIHLCTLCTFVHLCTLYTYAPSVLFCIALQSFSYYMIIGWPHSIYPFCIICIPLHQTHPSTLFCIDLLSPLCPALPS